MDPEGGGVSACVPPESFAVEPEVFVGVLPPGTAELSGAAVELDVWSLPDGVAAEASAVARALSPAVIRPAAHTSRTACATEPVRSVVIRTVYGLISAAGLQLSSAVRSLYT